MILIIQTKDDQLNVFPYFENAIMINSMITKNLLSAMHTR